MNGELSPKEKDRLLEGLDSPDEEVRRLSVEQLLLLPLAECTQQLCRHLGDPGWRVRKAAVERAVACGREAVVQKMLVGALADGENPGRRNAAFEALTSCGELVVPRLITELGSEDVDVRKLAVDALAAIGASPSRIALRALLEDADANVRAAAAEALGVVGGMEEITALLAIAREGDEELLVRISALRALSMLEASVGVASLSAALENGALLPAIHELLGFSSDPHALEVLIKGLSSPGRSTREGAMAALLRRLSRLDVDAADQLVQRLQSAAEADQQLVERICERLEDADLGTRIVLVQFLGLLSDPRSVEPVLLATRDEAVEELAEGTLASFGDRLPTALEAIWDGLDPDLRRRACRSLGRVGGEVAERLLANALREEDSRVRSVAATALGEGAFFDRMPDLVRSLESAAKKVALDGDEEVGDIVTALVTLADHGEAEEAGVGPRLIGLLASRLAGATEPLRLAIARVLARLGSDQHEDLIGFLLKDESARVRRAAVHALGHCSSERARDRLRLSLGDEAVAVRIAAATALGGSGDPEASASLTGAMSDEDVRVSCAAIRSLGRIHRGAGLAACEAFEGVFVRALEGEPSLALAALDALAEIGGEGVADLALQAISRAEPEVVRAGVACVGKHGCEWSLSETLPALAHGDWSVRAEVVRILSDRGHRTGLPSLLRRLEVEGDAFVREAILRALDRLEG